MTICFVWNQKRLKWRRVGRVGGKHAHVRRVGRHMLFLRAKRKSGDRVINEIFPPISNPATQVAPRKGFFVIIAFSSNNFVNKNK